MKACLIMAMAGLAVLQARGFDCDGFPSENEIYLELRRINEDFLRAEEGRDNWAGFVPLLENVVAFQHSTPKELKTKAENSIVERFTLYSFACEHDRQQIKAEFSGRMASIGYLSSLDIVKTSTNSLFKLADWLAGAVMLPADYKTSGEALAAAAQQDALVIYGGRRPPVFPGSLGNTKRFGPAMRECQAKFHFRRLYNERLPGFRTAALRCFYSAVKEGFEGATDEERQTIWDEFCRRAKASAGEKANAEKADESISMLRAWALAVDGAGRHLENVDEGVDKGTELLRAASKCGKDAMNPNIASCLVSFVDNPAYPDLEEARSLSDSRATTDVSNNNASAEHVGFVRRLEEPSSPEKAKEEQR